ncbi:MAG: NADH-quinone oxidoreductase subunit NuoD [Candidatus Methanomethylicota archaeon]|nr:MAG: NADH-quinone oxidoreductase subunit NuoD [Candidatus Verstraetearchaeota archaeon]
MVVSEAKEIMRISWGPQHPMSGQFRFILETDGENVYEIIPDFGFTHRGIEKILEYRTFVQGIVPFERLAMVDAANVGLAYVRAIEDAAGIEVPKRAQYIRTILCEISRINSHLYAIGLAAEAAGGYPAIFLWTTADRELFLDLAEMLTGARWSYAFFIPGGVRADIPEGFKERALKVLSYFEKRLIAYRDSWLENEIWLTRSRGVGRLSAEDAIKLGAAGPSLRGSGVELDMRKEEKYEAYEELNFKVAVQKEGDCQARFMVRFLEMIESTKIIRQALENLPPGPFKKPVPPKLPKGEGFARVETARGEMDVHVILDGSDKPYRVKVCAPSFRNLYVISKLPKLTKILVADVPVVIWSFDPWYLDADR